MMTRIAAVTAALALTASPALAAPPDYAQGLERNSSTGVPTPVADPRPPATERTVERKGNGRAYGRYCRGQSKKHVQGQRGTPFSQCVKAMAQLAKDERSSARKACKALSKEHVDGESGTAFSKCVKGARELREETTTD